MSRFWNALTRRKTDDVHEGESQLARVLNLFDLTALGVGSTLGLGVYVLAGQVAYNIAGPAVTISFLIAALASAFAGICYAEFAARVPKAGSAYVYSYVTIGEFVAFTIGWNLILEYVIGTASVARGLSGYFDSLIDNNMSKALNESMHIDVSFLGDYPDFLSFGMVLLLAGLLAFGAKESSFLNNIFTSINLVTIGIVLVAGGMNGESSFSLSLLFNINAFSPSLRQPTWTTGVFQLPMYPIGLALVASCPTALLASWQVRPSASLALSASIALPQPARRPSIRNVTFPWPSSSR